MTAQPETDIASPQAGNGQMVEKVLGVVGGVLAAGTLGDGFAEGADNID